MTNKKRTIIGVSGSKGSFSEEAALYYCDKNDWEGALKYLVSAENTLKALDKGDIERAIFPIENSNGGLVYEAVQAMSRYVFQIEKIFEIDIKHCLLVSPGVNSSQIKKIVSHQQALRQCRMYLKRKWPEVELLEYSDTAEAAKDLGSGKLSRDSAVIAPQVCAELYELETLEEGVQDLKFNFTSFVVAVK